MKESKMYDQIIEVVEDSDKLDCVQKSDGSNGPTVQHALAHLHSDAKKNIPVEIQKLDQWITWLYGDVDPKTGKRRKLPKGKDGTGLGWQKEHQWMGFAEAISAAKRRGHAGIGLVLPAMVYKGEHLVATDHDKVGLTKEPDTKKNKRLAEIEGQFKALGKPYTEQTPSGDGMRMLVTSREQLSQVSSSPNPLGGADELFCASSRWITVTGDKMAGDGVPDATDAITKLHSEWTARQPKAPKEPPPKSNATLLQHLVRPVGFQWPAEKLKDGDGREATMLRYAGHLRGLGHTQDEIEKMALVANQEHYADPLDEDDVLGRCRRYEGQQSQVVSGGVVLQVGQVLPPAQVRFSLTDTGNAERLRAELGDCIAWVHEHNTWLQFSGGGWHQRTHADMVELATGVMKKIFSEAAEANNPMSAKAIAVHAAKSLNSAALSNTIELLKAQPRVQLRSTQLDIDDMVIGAENGVVIDLHTGQARTQQPTDYITKSTGCTYDPSATCPTWDAFLRSLFCGLDGSADTDDDQGMIGYLQMAMGYMLTGRVSEKQFFFLHGGGDNGKSRVAAVVKELWGSYAVQSSTSAFMQKQDGGGATPELARLQGMRVVIASETEEKQILAEGLVKAITGGESFTARQLYGAPFDFMPKFKLFMSGNDRPTIRSDGRAIWSRIHLVPLSRTFELHEQDSHLADKLSKELSGILNWAIQGCLMWQQVGRLVMPKRMVQEVQRYKSDMDLIQQWMDECCNLGATLTATSADVYRSFSHWAKNNGHRVFSQTRFSLKLIERKFEKTHTRTGKVWHGFECHQIPLAGWF